jgi:hypothetical protein
MSLRSHITCMAALCATLSSTGLILFAGVAAACSGTGGGGGCPAPSVSTGGVTSITSNNATLHGSVNPQGCYTEYAFEYGRSSEGYPNEIGGSAGSGTSSVSVQTYSALGLQPNTSYHYRLSAWNSGGETTGGSGSFTTPPECSKPSVTSNLPFGVGQHGVWASFFVNPNGCTTTWELKYGTSSPPSTPYSSGSLNKSEEFSVAIQNLKTNTQYYYQLVAKNSKGTTEGTIRGFKTSP